MCRNPCWRNGNDCPDRHVGCRSGCRDWQDYEAAKQEEYDKRTIAYQAVKTWSKQEAEKLARRRYEDKYRMKKKLGI